MSELEFNAGSELPVKEEALHSAPEVPVTEMSPLPEEEFPPVGEQKKTAKAPREKKPNAVKLGLQAHQADPSTLWRDPRFWSQNRMVALVMSIGLAILFFLFIYYFPKPTGSPGYDIIVVAIYSAIVATGLWGARVTMQVFTRIFVDNGFALKTAQNCSDELREIRSGNKPRTELSSLDQLLPANPHPSLGVPRLCQHILEEARDRKFESSVILMEPYKEESVSDAGRLQAIQKTALHFGILGTFVGLINAFVNLNIGDLSSSLNLVSQSLQFKFGASIAGLVCAIFLGFALMYLRKRQEQFFQNMENAAVALLALARNSINRDDFLTEFTQINHSVKQLNETVYQQNTEVKEQTRVIGKGLERLSEARDDFNAFLNDFSEEEKKFIGEMSRYHNVVSPETISKKLEQSLNASVKGVTKALESSLGKTMEAYQQIAESSTQLNQLMSTISSGMEVQHKQLAESMELLTKSKHSFSESMNTIEKSNANFIGKITGSHISESLKNQITQVGGEIATAFAKNLQELNQRVTAYEANLGAFNQRVGSFLEDRSASDRRFRTAALVLLGFSGLLITAAIIAAPWIRIYFSSEKPL